MISNVYSYYLSQYGNKYNSKYESHTKAQLKNMSGKVMKINSQTPAYKIDTSEDAQKYAIDLKENAIELVIIANDLTDKKDGSINYKKAATSSDPEAIEASYIGDEEEASVDAFDINVSQLASNQINISNFLAPNSKHIESGSYSFDVNINNLTYEIEFDVEKKETTKDIQEKISRLINNSNIGLNSKVVSDSNGNTALSIESDTTGLTNDNKNVIFSIQDNDDDYDAYSDDNSVYTKSKTLINTLGLNRVSQYPENAIFSINGSERSSTSNDISINKTFSLSFNKTTDNKTVHIGLQTDKDSIADSINELVTGYNQLLSVSNNSNNDKFIGNAKLRKEFINLAKTYSNQLNSTGLNVSEDGHININKDTIVNAADSGTLHDIFAGLTPFKTALQNKAEDIAFNPMEYVNNKIIAYKNPHRQLNDPYNLSAYTGMMFNGYI